MADSQLLDSDSSESSEKSSSMASAVSSSLCGCLPVKAGEVKAGSRRYHGMFRTRYVLQKERSGREFACGREWFVGESNGAERARRQSAKNAISRFMRDICD